MRGVLKAATILSWFNIIVWGIIVAIGLLAGLLLQSLPLIVLVFLVSVIVLNNYADLQLHKSIRNPAIPLGHQTPVGVRFLGYIALFFGVSEIANGIAILQNIQQVVTMMQEQVNQLKSSRPAAMPIQPFNARALAGFLGVATLLLGLCISVNVFLNFRLLRWYAWMKQQQNENQEK